MRRRPRKVDDDQLFYCRSRGMDEEEAVALVVNGFCKDVLQTLPMEFAMEAQAWSRSAWKARSDDRDDHARPVEGFQIAEYLGIVAGEAILGANIVRDVFAGLTDIFGGRSGAYEQQLGLARETALKEMEQAATERGATAVVGVDLDYEVINGMLMVTASGTAVRLG